MPNYYQILEIKPDATEDELKARWRELARRYHPDAHQNGSTDEFSAITTAYAVLSDPIKRRSYDFQQAFEGLAVINYVSNRDLPLLKEHFEFWKFHILHLDGTKIYDKKSFIEQAYKDLPNLYGYQTGDNWNTFIDVLGDGLSLIPERFISLVWTDAHNMLQKGLPSLIEACFIFEQVTQHFLAVEAERKGLVVILSGVGDNFPPLKSHG